MNLILLLTLTFMIIAQGGGGDKLRNVYFKHEFPRNCIRNQMPYIVYMYFHFTAKLFNCTFRPFVAVSRCRDSQVQQVRVCLSKIISHILLFFHLHSPF